MTAQSVDFTSQTKKHLISEYWCFCYEYSYSVVGSIVNFTHTSYMAWGGWLCWSLSKQSRTYPYLWLSQTVVLTPGGDQTGVRFSTALLLTKVATYLVAMLFCIGDLLSCQVVSNDAVKKQGPLCDASFSLSVLTLFKACMSIFNHTQLSIHNRCPFILYAS